MAARISTNDQRVVRGNFLQGLPVQGQRTGCVTGEVDGVDSGKPAVGDRRQIERGAASAEAERVVAEAAVDDRRLKVRNRQVEKIVPTVAAERERADEIVDHEGVIVGEVADQLGFFDVGKRDREVKVFQ